MLLDQLCNSVLYVLIALFVSFGFVSLGCNFWSWNKCQINISSKKGGVTEIARFLNERPFKM